MSSEVYMLRNCICPDMQEIVHLCVQCWAIVYLHTSM